MPDKNVQLPDGRIVAFPDSMADADISAVIKKQLNPQPQQIQPAQPAAQQPLGSAVARNMAQVPTDTNHPIMSALAQEGMTDLNEATAKAEFAKQHPWLNAVGDILSTAIVPSGQAAANALPSTVRAGANLSKTAAAVGAEKLAVPREVSGAADQVMKLASQGGQKPKIVSDFLEYATNPDKGLAWDDLRRFMSMAGRKTFLDSNSQVIKDPAMLRSLGQFYGSLREWSMDIAEQHGVLEPFEQGLREYGNAKALQGAGQFIKQMVIPKTPTGAMMRAPGYLTAGYGAYRLIRDLF